MRKFNLLLFMLILIFSLISCGRNFDDKSEEDIIITLKREYIKKKNKENRKHYYFKNVKCQKYYGKFEDDYVISFVFTNVDYPQLTKEIILGGIIFDDSGPAYCIYHDKEMYTIREIYEEGIYNSDDLQRLHNFMYGL